MFTDLLGTVEISPRTVEASVALTLLLLLEITVLSLVLEGGACVRGGACQLINNLATLRILALTRARFEIKLPRRVGLSKRDTTAADHFVPSSAQI